MERRLGEIQPPPDSPAGAFSRWLVLLAAVALIVAAAGCAVRTVPAGVLGGADLPSDLSLVLREGMHVSDLLSRFGAPAERMTRGGVTTLIYTEFSRERHRQLEFLGVPLFPDASTHTRLTLVFVGDALKRAWVDVSGDGGKPGTRWLIGAPEPGTGEPP